MDRFGDFFPSDSDADLDPLFDSTLDDAAAHDESVDAPPPSPVGQDERRMQVRAYNHWASLLGDAAFPDIADLDPEALEDFGPYSVLLDFSAGVEDPGVRFLGSELASECGAEDIALLSDVPTRSLLSRITDHYMQIIANQAPIGFEAEFVNERGNTALYRGILLPYSSDTETIDFIYGVINWKEVADRSTADALLLEIGQALGIDSDDSPMAPSPSLDALLPLNNENTAATDEDVDSEPVGEEDAVLDLGVAGTAIDDDLPAPVFGASSGESSDGLRPQVPASMAPGTASDADWSLPEEDGEEDGEDDAFEHAAIGETAQDYGLDDDWDEPDYDDVDDVVDPLADESVGEGLSSLVTRGARLRPVVDLPSALETDQVDVGDEQGDVAPEPEDPVELSVPASDTTPPAYAFEEPLELGMEDAVADEPATDEPFHAGASEFEDLMDLGHADIVADEQFVERVSEEAPVVTVAAPDAAFDGPSSDDADAQAEGLYDTLAEAREMAATARNSEDRSRSALYAAVGRAYDFSLEAQDDPDAFAELVADAGLTVQDRAPMTPIVKLVFGSDYDKTRLTEYAAVLTHAHRLELQRGALGDFLANAEGGVKGVVQAERRARKEEAGKPVEDTNGVRAAIAEKLRRLEAIAFADLPSDGPEFALVMVRRNADGHLEVVGEVPEDIPLVERAARTLLS